MSAEIIATLVMGGVGLGVVVGLAVLVVTQNRGIVSAPRVSLRGCPVPRMDGQS